jgi:glycosyltransferase involved in cell wall biosynthesis
MKISVVIPCYNEESSIRGVIKSLTAEIGEVIVVDNDSSDQTKKIAEASGARVITEKQRGYGAAIKCGIAEATGDIIVTIDGDGQHPADEILPMVRRLEKDRLDFLVGSRFPLEGAKMRPVRIIGNYLFNIVVRLLFNITLKDTQSGMWVFRRSVLKEITLESDGMSVSQEIKIRVAHSKGLRFAEYHIVCRERSGVSKLSPLKDGFRNLFALVRLRRSLLNEIKNHDR